MSQKTLFTKSALAVAVAIISTQAWSAGFQLNEISSSGLGRAYSVKARLRMMQETPVVTRH
ncbi:outer membrane protein transport protein [Shigella flexneri]